MFKGETENFKESLYLCKHDFALYLPWFLKCAFFISFEILIISRKIFYLSMHYLDNAMRVKNRVYCVLIVIGAENFK